MSSVKLLPRSRIARLPQTERATSADVSGYDCAFACAAARYFSALRDDVASGWRASETEPSLPRLGFAPPPSTANRLSQSRTHTLTTVENSTRSSNFHTAST